jgi:gluconate kinase
MQLDNLIGWLPIRMYWQESSPIVDWCYLGDRRFTEPFFDETITESLRHPFTQLFQHQTSVEVLREWQGKQPGLYPTGFIFHMSRCGSTLASQMLASLPQNIILSEAPPIDSVLRANHRSIEITDDTRVSWLRWMVSALGQQRSGDESHLFIKFDSWHILDFNVIKKAFPDVPWVFLYREPVDVLVSQLGRRGLHMVPGVIEPTLFGLNASIITEIPPEEYCARVLSSICQAALNHSDDPRAMFINYNQLPEAMWSHILDFFNVPYSSGDVERMKAVAQFDAKNPLLSFAGDAATKRRKAADIVVQVAEQWLAPVYEGLEARRAQ